MYPNGSHNNPDFAIDDNYTANGAAASWMMQMFVSHGVGDAMVFGQQNYSMRIILNPLLMAKLGLTPTDIAAIIREQNRDFPAGTIGRELAENPAAPASPSRGSRPCRACPGSRRRASSAA